MTILNSCTKKVRKIIEMHYVYIYNDYYTDFHADINEDFWMS